MSTNDVLSKILDPLFEYISKNIKPHRILDLINFAYCCKSTYKKHNELMERSLRTHFGCKIGYVYNTLIKHGVHVYNYQVTYDMDTVLYCTLVIHVYTYGLDIENIDIKYTNRGLVVGAGKFRIIYRVDKIVDDVDVLTIVNILKTLKKCTFTKTGRTWSFDDESAELLQKYHIKREFESTCFRNNQSVDYPLIYFRD